MLKLGPRTAEELTVKTKGTKAASVDKAKDKSKKAEKKPVANGAVNGAEMTGERGESRSLKRIFIIHPLPLSRA